MDLLFIANINHFLKASLRSDFLSCSCICLCAFWFIPCPTRIGQAVGPCSVIKKLNWRQVQCDWIHHVPQPKMCVVFATVASLHLCFLKLSENLAIPTSPAAWNVSVLSGSPLNLVCALNIRFASILIVAVVLTKPPTTWLDWSWVLLRETQLKFCQHLVGYLCLKTPSASQQPLRNSNKTCKLSLMYWANITAAIGRRIWNTKLI